MKQFTLYDAEISLETADMPLVHVLDGIFRQNDQLRII